MTPSATNESPHDGQPDKRPQIGRREIGAFLPGAAVTPPAEPATLVAS